MNNFKRALEMSTSALALPPMLARQRDGLDQNEVDVAYGMLMTGPKAQRPRWKTVRRIIWQMRRGIMRGGRTIEYMVDGKFHRKHPTKRRQVEVF